MVAMTVPTDVVSGTAKDWSLITGGLLTALEEDDSAEELDEILEEELLADELDVTAFEEECAFMELDEMLEEEFLTEELDEPSDADEDSAVADEGPAPDELVGVLAEKLEVMAIEESPHVDAGISSGAVAEYSEQEIESKAVMETAPNRIFFFILNLL